MKPSRSSVICVCLAVAVVSAILLWPRHTPDSRETADPSRSERVRSLARPTQEGFATTDPVAVQTDGAAAETLPEIGAWAYEVPREPDFSKLTAFDQWIVKWKTATPEEREALKAEGAGLAGERRAEFKALIAFDPRQALEKSVPRVLRQELPAEIVAQLEKPVSAVGDYNVYQGRPAPGMEVAADALTLRYFEADGVSYKARVFGDLTNVISRKGVPLRGVSVDRELAIAENSVRVFERGEIIPAGTTVEETCPVSGKTTEAVSSGEAVTEATPTVEIGQQIITLCDGSHVSVLEEDFRTYIQASGPGGGGYFMDNFPGTFSRAIGNFRCLYIRVTYPDQMTQPNTEDQAYADMRDNARYYLESSYGKMTQTTTVTSLVTLPHTLAWYKAKDGDIDCLGLIHSDSSAEAKKLGYDPGQYDCIIVRINKGPRLEGISWGGGNRVWITWSGMDVLNHECGHSLGRNHANYWTTTDGTAYGDGSNNEYGNPFDVMGGGGGYSAHYNTISKRALGWLPENQVNLPKINGVYRIYAYDQPQLEQGKRYALSVAKDSIRSYNLEYHPARGALLADTALVLYSGMGSNAGHLLDTTPGSPGGKNDGGIAVGRTFSDYEADMHFTVLAKNATTPPSLDIAYNRGPFPGNLPPVVSLAASATSISTGGSVTFTATASDPNGDLLTYHWQFDDGVTGTNGSSYTRTFTAAAQVNALLTVSDMKGGIARRSVVINVGSHGKQAITGTVTSGGNPVQGVYISNGTKFCFSNVDGSYALAGLSTGAQTLTATLPGYSFAPSFTNPITVVAGTNTANWSAAADTQVTLTKIADANEGGANGVFRFTRTGSTTDALTVRVSPVGGTATKTTDYTFAPDYATDDSYRTFTIPSGSTTLDVVVAAVNDTGAEGPETISLQLASNGKYSSVSGNAAVMTVVDNDTTLPQVGVTAPDPYAAESPTAAHSGTFTFTRTGATTAALNLSVAWSGGAGNGTDYTSLPGTVVIPAGQGSVDVIVNPIDDALIEVQEDVVATINTSGTYLRGPGVTTATVTITDDDSPVVSVSVLDAEAKEAGQNPGIFLITRTGSTAAPLKVYYGVSGSALHGTDYAPLTGELTIPAGATGAPVVITPYDDDLGEPVESVTLAVTTFNDAYSLGTAFQASLNIIDNGDVPVVSVRGGTVGTEGGSNATVVFRAIGSTAGTITVNYTVSGSATPGSDYTALSGSVAISSNGTNDVTVNIPIINDTLVEPAENVIVKITPGAAYRVYNDGSAEAVILDNDSGDRVQVSTFNQSPSEAGPTTARYYISRTGTSGALTVNYAMSGTATNGVDYQTLSGSIDIPDTALGVDLALTPVDDSLVEGTETATLTILPGSGYGVDRVPSATYEIADNDNASVTVGFQLGAQAMSEQPGGSGEYRDIAVVLSAASANTITVDFTAGGGTASGDDTDWGFVDAANGNAPIPGGRLTFAPGVTSQNLRIRIKNDGVSEGSETAVLLLRAPYNAGITSGRGQQSIIIYDGPISNLVTEERWNDGAVYTNNTWNNSSPNYTGYLGGFTTEQDVADNYSRRLSGLITAPATGSYTFWIASDDASRLYLSTTSSAVNKAQIASVSGYTSFQAWETQTSQKSATFSLVAGQNYYMEVQHQEGGGGDHASVAWQGPGFSRTPITFAAPDIAPRFVRLLASSSTRMESDGGEPMLQAFLDRPAGSTPVTVNYSASGSATNGSDYTLPAGTLTFAAGEQAKQIPLVILNDAVTEGPESIIVTLANPSGATLLTPSTHTITLLDANAPVTADKQFTATSAMTAGSVIGTATATVASGRSIASWSIVAGNAASVFGINASGQVSLLLPGSLPNPGTRQLVVRVTDNLGATGDATINIVCNPPAFTGVSEQRFTGATAFNSNMWTGTPAYSGTLPTFTTPQDVADNYSRRLIGYLQPQTSGPYTFWLASDDAGKLFLSTDSTAGNKAQIASVSGYTDFQAWDSQASQKSATINLVAGQVYYLEAQQQEGGGGDHVSVAWSGPDFSRDAIPATAMFPTFGPPPILPTIAITSPASGAGFTNGSSVTLTATVSEGSLPVTAVEFYRGGVLLGSDSSSPYSVNWAVNQAVGVYNLTAKVIYNGGSITSAAVPVNVLNTAPTFTTTPITGSSATKDVAYSGSIASYGADVDPGDTRTFSKVSGPVWLNIATNGALSGVPGSGNVGSNAFLVQVTDSFGSTNTAILNITVIAPFVTPTVTIVASAPNANEVGPVAGKFTITRTGDTSAALALQLSLGGSASNGGDYATISTSLNMPIGAASVDVTVTPLSDGLSEGPETVVLSLVAQETYVFGSPSSATVSIADQPIDNWRAAKFAAQANNAAMSADAADPDRDGMVNLLEYALGGDPLDGITRMPSLKPGESSMLHLNLPDPVPSDLTYTVEGISEIGGAWQPLAQKVGAGGWTWLGGGVSRLSTGVPTNGQAEVDVGKPDSAAGQSKYFLRLKAERN